MSVSWDELKTHVTLADSTQLHAKELVDLIWRAMEPLHFCELAWMFAAQGEVVLWMHTLSSALRVLKKSESVHAFTTMYFTDANALTCHSAVQPHWDTMRLMFQTQAAYRSRNPSQRNRVLDAISVALGDHAQLLPFAHEQAAMNPINNDSGNHRPYRR